MPRRVGALGDGRAARRAAAARSGASGRVRTATTSWRSPAAPAATGRRARAYRRRRASVRAHLPTGRAGYLRRLPPSRPTRASRLAQARPSCARVEPVDEQDAVEVVGLVLDRAGQQLRALDADRVAVHVPAGRDHVQVPAAVPAEAGDGQAALRRPPRSPRRPASTSGLTRWPNSPSTYQVKTRRPTPICGAASPAPPARRASSRSGRRRAGAAPCRSRRPGGGGAQHGVAEQPDGGHAHEGPTSRGCRPPQCYGTRPRRDGGHTRSSGSSCTRHVLRRLPGAAHALHLGQRVRERAALERGTRTR